MNGLLLALAMGFLAFGMVTGLALASDSGSVSQTDGAFMTDRLLEKDMDRGAAPIKERDGGEESEETWEDSPTDRSHFDERSR